jgi:hypothetical protein
METITVSSIDQFVKLALEGEWLFEHYIYRGQAWQGNLLPGVARRQRRSDTEKEEQDSLRALEMTGASLLPPGKQTLLDLMVIGQHFGLKTRLLDWTTNPLMALFFACSDLKPGDVFVYALEADPYMDEFAYDEGFNPFAVPKTTVIRPRYNNPRLIAQSGWFTLHRFSQGAGAFVPLEKQSQEGKGPAHSLTEIKIPAENRRDLLFACRRLGATASTAYPDLLGLCQDINIRARLEPAYHLT